jgi:glycosyltransferase involved in cell wall biosynthesis
MKGIKILFLSHRFYPDIGGIEVNSEVLALEFAKAGHQVKLATWTVDQGKKSFVFEVIRNPSILDLLKLHFWADVVFENNPCLKLSWPAVISSKPVILALRTWVARNDGSIGWQDKLKLVWAKRAKGLIAVSMAVKENSGLPAKVIGNPYRNQIFKNINRERKQYSFVFLGRLVSDKGANFAIEAFAKIIEQYRPDESQQFKLTLIGDGPENARLMKLTQTLAISDYVEFTGRLEGKELVDKLNEHKYLLVPSKTWEAFGNVVLEGMACGCLPIVSSTGGLPDAAGEAGVIFDVTKPDELTKVLLELLKNPIREAEIRRNSVLHLSNHTPERIGNKYLEVIYSARRKT